MRRCAAQAQGQLNRTPPEYALSRRGEYAAPILVGMNDARYFDSAAPDRTEVAALPGPTVLEFGTDWCGHCLAARPFIAQALGAAPGVRHLKIEDGPGRALGRSFRVKLWPTLVFLRDGVELARVVRPLGVGAIDAALDRIHAVDAEPAGDG
jgi:thioredoxin 1